MIEESQFDLYKLFLPSLWSDNDDGLLDESLGECDRTLTSTTDLPLPEDSLHRRHGMKNITSSRDAALSDASLVSLPSIENASLPNDVEGLNRGMTDLSLVADNSFVDNTLMMDNTLMDHTFTDNTFVDKTLLDNTFVDNTLLDNTVINDTLTTNDASMTNDEGVEGESFVSDDTFHGMQRTAAALADTLTDTLTDVSQLSTLSSLPSAASSSEESASEVEKQETFL